MFCNKDNKIKSKKGFILLFTFIILLCMSVISLAIFSLAINEVRNSMLPEKEISRFQ